VVGCATRLLVHGTGRTWALTQDVISHHRGRRFDLFAGEHVDAGGAVAEALFRASRRDRDRFEQGRRLQHDLDFHTALAADDALGFLGEAAGAHGHRDVAVHRHVDVEPAVGPGQADSLRSVARFHHDRRAGHDGAGRILHHAGHGAEPRASRPEAATVDSRGGLQPGATNRT
jgi:hypothetical protein